MAKKKTQTPETDTLEVTTSQTVVTPEVETTVEAPVEETLAVTEELTETAEATEVPVEETAKKTKVSRKRGKKYTHARSLVDKTIEYPVDQAIELVKKMSYSKFDGSIEAHVEVKEAGISATITYPHSTGKTVRVAVVSEELIEQLNKGVIDFDVLLAKPADMKLLTKFARLLGPKGLMPNPKSGTLTPNPEAKRKELEAGAVTLKTERKAPLVHTIIGKVSMDTKDLQENLEALLKGFEHRIVRIKICASMSPSVRVAVEK